MVLLILWILIWRIIILTDTGSITFRRNRIKRSSTRIAIIQMIRIIILIIRIIRIMMMILGDS